MSSAVLYLAIVAVWAVVLVPMWLRRDTDASGVSRFIHKREEITLEEPVPDETPTEEYEERPEPRRPGRATVIARRRRRTAGLTLLLLTTAAVVPTGLAPWWITIPPLLLLTGHLALLRVAVGMDAARARAAAEERAREAAQQAAAAARTEAAAAAQAEVIDLVARAEEEVFDQYADDRRAVGE
ncbi:divisome protein SepX/GlpR [Actinomadura macrotermitis]|uniref:Uncharacterized protein n=1 Tax=Actinomadura macrotermitis TaxID=2585200 RepID=A0A7K0BSG6_9ACTN|nr:hypothetical protein [Actinomadura macrotermitis]